MDRIGEELIADLQRDAKRYDALADEAEQKARELRRKATHARCGVEYLIKSGQQAKEES